MRALVLLLLMVSTGGRARAGDGPMDLAAAVHAGAWDAAARMAAGAADPVALRLVRYLRALAPGADAGGVLAEMEAEPDWPLTSALARRYADGLVGERDDRVVDGLCQRLVPGTVPALLRCAGVMAHGEVLARQAWVSGITDGPAEVAFMKRWAAMIGPGVQAARFERLAWVENGLVGGALARQAVRVEPGMRAAAEVLLALKRGDVAGADLFAGLSAGGQAEPVMMLELARWYRRADRDDAAAGVWAERGAAAEAAAPVERRGAFWSERNTLTRKLLRAQSNALAFSVSAGAGPTSAGGANGDALFLSGWIALRRLMQPGVAAAQFRALAATSGAATSGSAITQGRAGYWLGRALQAAGDAAGAAAAFREGAAWGTTYYGQLAALAGRDDMGALETRIAGMRDPGWDAAMALTFAGSDLAQAATLLVGWGQVGRAKAFVSGLEQRDPAGRSIVGSFAAALGMPDQAVSVARRAGGQGVMLPVVGWPDGVTIPIGRVAPAVALGVIRQESSFDVLARSPVGAMGLMQLMPATAVEVSRSLGVAVGALTDAAVNVRLGTTYLGAQLDRFGALPPALAAYNAGPHRVQDWLAANGDPASGAVDPIDWVELIPFDETRNYVQRIVESVLIYRAREGVVLPHPVLAWTQGSGI